MALIAVLWIVSLLALLAAGIMSSSRVSNRLAFNALENTKARFLAEAGVNRAIYSLLKEDVFQSPLVDGSSSLASRTGEGYVTVQIRDEDGKVDLNFATAELLAGLIGNVWQEGDDAARGMAERIVDYRDGDNIPLPSDAQYMANATVNPLRGSTDRPFRQVEELSSVLGMTDALYQRLKHHVTVYGEAEGFDPLRASEPVLGALPGITSEAHALIRASNVDGDLLSILPDGMSRLLEDYIVTSRDLVFEVRALGQTRGGGHFLQEAVIALDDGRGRLPFKTYRWRRGTLAEDDLLIAMSPMLSPSP